VLITAINKNVEPNEISGAPILESTTSSQYTDLG